MEKMRREAARTFTSASDLLARCWFQPGALSIGALLSSCSPFRFFCFSLSSVCVAPARMSWRLRRKKREKPHLGVLVVHRASGAHAACRERRARGTETGRGAPRGCLERARARERAARRGAEGSTSKRRERRHGFVVVVK
jgi:hypothetical protein